MELHAERKLAVRTRRTQEERRATSRAVLIDSAIRHLRERGLSATNMAEIAADANLTRGAIQHHFANRADLIFAVVSELDGRLAAAFDGFTLPNDMGAVDRVAALFDLIATLTLSADSVAVYDLWTAGRSDPELRGRMVELQRPLTERFRALWRRTLDGHVPPHLIELCIGMVLTMSQGASMALLFGQEPEATGATLRSTRAMLLEFMGRSMTA